MSFASNMAPHVFRAFMLLLAHWYNISIAENARPRLQRPRASHRPGPPAVPLPSQLPEQAPREAKLCFRRNPHGVGHWGGGKLHIGYRVLAQSARPAISLTCPLWSSGSTWLPRQFPGSLRLDLWQNSTAANIRSADSAAAATRLPGSCPEHQNPHRTAELLLYAFFDRVARESAFGRSPDCAAPVENPRCRLRSS